MTHLHRLFAHLAWADRRVLRLLREQPDARTPAVLRPLAHLLAAERVWLLRLRGEDTGQQPVWPELGLDEMEALAESNAAAYARYLSGSAAHDPHAEVAYRNTQGAGFRTRVHDLLLHVALHGAYHRGQVAAAVRAAGGEPVNTDFVTYAREEGWPGQGHGE